MPELVTEQLARRRLVPDLPKNEAMRRRHLPGAASIPGRQHLGYRFRSAAMAADID